MFLSQGCQFPDIVSDLDIVYFTRGIGLMEVPYDVVLLAVLLWNTLYYQGP